MTWIFDALTHPCLDANYLGRGLECDFASLDLSLQKTSVKWACAVGLEGIGSYSHEAFATECRKYPHIIPVAAFNPLKASTEELLYLKSLGYLAIKLHPRISKFKISSPELEATLEACQELALPVLLCSYHYGSLDTCPVFETIANLLARLPKLKLMLVHGGAVEVLRYMELARAYPNVLLDLSMTLIKYEGSSIDLDLKFLFEKFDRRICVGSDHPEYSLDELSRRFEFFSASLTQDKKTNIAYRNLQNFLGIKDLAPAR